MDAELKQRLDAIDVQLAEIHKQTKQTKSFIGWQLAIQILVIILPIILAAVMVPVIMSMLGSFTGSTTGDINTDELLQNVEELKRMSQ